MFIYFLLQYIIYLSRSCTACFKNYSSMNVLNFSESAINLMLSGSQILTTFHT